MAVQSSFYGGRQGASIVLKKYYDAIDIDLEKITKRCLLTYEKEQANLIKKDVEDNYNNSYVNYFARNYTQNSTDAEIKAKTDDIQAMIDDKLYRHKFYACNNITRELLLTSNDENGLLIERNNFNYAAYTWRAVPLNGKNIVVNYTDSNGVAKIKTFPNTTVEAQGMVQEFRQGGLTTNSINYGDYVIIDTISNMGDTNNPDNGKIFRRGLNYINKTTITNEYGETVEYYDGGAEYVGQIVGPKGSTPDITISNIHDVKIQQRANESKWGLQEITQKSKEWMPHESTEEGIVPGYIQHYGAFTKKYFISKKVRTNVWGIYLDSAEPQLIELKIKVLADDLVNNRPYKWDYAATPVYYNQNYELTDKNGKVIKEGFTTNVYIETTTGNAYYYTTTDTAGNPIYTREEVDSSGNIIDEHDLVTGSNIGSHTTVLKLRDGFWVDGVNSEGIQNVGFLFSKEDGNIILADTYGYVLDGDTYNNENGTITVDEYLYNGDYLRVNDGGYVIENDDTVAGTEVKKVLEEFHDGVKYAWSTIRDEAGGVTGVLLGFEFPYLVPEMTTKPRSSYWTEEDLLAERSDLIYKGEYGKGNLNVRIEPDSQKTYNEIVEDYLKNTNSYKNNRFVRNGISYNIREYYEAYRSLEKVNEAIDSIISNATTANNLKNIIALYHKIYTITVGQPIEELELFEDTFGRVSDEDTRAKGIDHHSFYRKWKIDIPQGLRGTSSNQLEVYPTEVLPSATVYLDKEKSAVAPAFSEIVKIGVPQALRDIPLYELTDEQKAIIEEYDGRVDNWGDMLPCYVDDSSSIVYWVDFENAYLLHIRYRETKYDEYGDGRDYKLIDIGEYNVIDSIDLTDDGWLRVQYTARREQPTTLNAEGPYDDPKDPIQWVNDIDYPQNGHVVFTYNTKDWQYRTEAGNSSDFDYVKDGNYYKIVRDENGKPIRDTVSQVNKTAEFDVTWPQSVSLSPEGLLKFTYNNAQAPDSWYMKQNVVDSSMKDSVNNIGWMEYTIPWLTSLSLDRHGKFKVYFNNDDRKSQIEKDIQTIEQIADGEDQFDGVTRYPSSSSFVDNDNYYQTQIYWVDRVEISREGKIYFWYCVYTPQYLALSDDERRDWALIHSWQKLGVEDRANARTSYINNDPSQEAQLLRLEGIDKYYKVPDDGYSDITIKWIDDVRIDTGVVYDEATEELDYRNEGQEDQYIHVTYNTLDDNGENETVKIGAPINYIVEYIYTSKDLLLEKDAELKQAVTLSGNAIANYNHYLIYYSDPAFRQRLKKLYPGRTVCYWSYKLNDVRYDWFDLGDAFVDAIGLKIIGDITNVSYKIVYNSIDPNNGMNYLYDVNNPSTQDIVIIGKDLFSTSINGKGIPPEVIQYNNENLVNGQVSGEFYAGWAYTAPLLDGDGNPVQQLITAVNKDDPTDDSVSLRAIDTDLRELWIFDYTVYKWMLSGVVGSNAATVQPEKVIHIGSWKAPDLYENGAFFETQVIKCAY